MAKDNQPDNPAKKTPDPLMEPVRQYLEKRAAEDPQFAEKFNNPKKSLKDCCAYIYGEAKKRAGGSQCVYIPPEEVFGMAVHYYDEDDIKVTSAGYTGRATVAPKPVELTAEQKAKAEQAALEKYEAEQRAKIEAREKEKAKAEAAKRKAAREEAERRKAQEGEFNLFNMMGI